MDDQRSSPAADVPAQPGIAGQPGLLGRKIEEHQQRGWIGRLMSWAVSSLHLSEPPIIKTTGPGLNDPAAPTASPGHVGAHAAPGAVAFPRDATEFIGRQALRDKIQRFVRHNRLVTLTGIGGVGKTRLAKEVAWEMAANLPDGIRFVDLTRLRRQEAQSEADVWETVRAQLAIQPGYNRSSKEVTLDDLRERQLLIVLDNCEHLLAHARPVASALAGLPGLHVLATSRARLGLKEEQPLSVEIMEMPRLDAPDTLFENEAVRLFLSRAGLGLDPAREEDAEALISIARLCIRLDRLPLAILLAAARMAAFSSVENMTGQYHRLLDLLEVHPGDADRHKTMRSAITWSYDLLSEPARALLRRLSVLQGGWTHEEALIYQVAGSDDSLYLSELLDASLVHRLPGGPPQQYVLLETIREFAAGLLEGEERAAAQESHQRYYLDQVFCAAMEAAQSPRSRPEDRKAALNALKQKEANIRAALEACVAGRGDAERGQQRITRVVSVLETVLPAPHDAARHDWFQALYPFALACEKPVEVWEIPLINDGAHWLKKLYVGLRIRRVFETGQDWEALFGGKEPGLKLDKKPGVQVMFRLEDDEEWEKEMLCTIAVLADMEREKPHEAHLGITCIFFLVHFWWELFDNDSAFRQSEKVLDAWEQHCLRGREDPLLQQFRRFRAGYPPQSEYRGRGEKTATWRSLAGSLDAVREMLGIARMEEADEQAATPLVRYVRGMTNLYLAEATRYLPGDPRRDDYRALCGQSLRLFGAPLNNDPFHRMWSLHEAAVSYQEAGENETALRYSRLGIDMDLDEAQGNVDDAEFDLMARMYRVMADACWQLGERQAVWSLHAGAVMLEYACLLDDHDTYGIKAYREQRDRTLDRLALLAREGDAAAFQNACMTLRRFWQAYWGDSPLPDFEALRACGESHMLADSLFPPVPALKGIASSGTDEERREAVRALRQARRVFQALPAVMERADLRDVFAPDRLPYRFAEAARLFRKIKSFQEKT